MQKMLFKLPISMDKIYLKQGIRDVLKGDMILALAGVKTITLFDEGTDLDDVERSLEIIIEDVRLRQGKTRGTNSNKVSG